MSRRQSAAFVAIAWLIWAGAACLAQTSEQPRPDIPWQQWLSQPERREIRWNLSISTSRLTYDLRHLLLIDLQLDERAFAAKPDLHLLIKAGDDSRWYAPEDYSHYAVEELGHKLTIQFLSALYLAPGRHVLGIILYDSANQRRSVTRRTVHVPAAGHDLLTSFDNQLPPVEFASVNGDETTGQRWKAPDRGHHPRISRRILDIFGSHNQITMLSRVPDRRLLRLAHPAPLQIDVLVDFTPTSQLENSSRAYSASESAMWGILRVLALLKPAQGCVLLTGIDVLGQKVIFQRVDAGIADWAALADAIRKIDAETVDLRALEAHQRMSEFFRDQVSRLTAGDEGCPALPPNAQHVLIIAAEGVIFPTGTPHSSAQAAPGQAVRLYYLRRGNPWDEMEHIVKPLHPHHFSADTPQNFRQSLLRIVTELGGLQ